MIGLALVVSALFLIGGALLEHSWKILGDKNDFFHACMCYITSVVIAIIGVVSNITK